SSAPGVQVLLGQGGGAFGAPVVTPLVGVKAFDVGDVNGDGHADLVTVFELVFFSSYAMQAQLGDGAGGFVPAASVDVSASSTIPAVKLLDADEDGDLDAVLEQAGKLRVCLGDGAGGFAAPGPFVTAPIAPAKEIHVLDVNGDGHLDLVCSGNAFFPTGWADYLGDGHGGFVASQFEYTLADADLYNSAVGDFDGDHRTDLVLDQLESQCFCVQLSFAQGTGSGFAVPSPADFGPPGFPNLIRAGDLDGDGLADLAANYGAKLGLLQGRGDFTFTGLQLIDVAPPGTFPPDVRLADVDGDGRLDVLVLQQSAEVALLLNASPPSGWTDLG